MAASTPELDTLQAIIGEELLQQVMKELGGCFIYIPKERKLRDKDICESFYRGESANSIALRHNLTYFHVIRIVDRHRKLLTNKS